MSGGGEPLMNPDIQKFIKATADFDFDLGLITNLNIYNVLLYRTILECAQWCRISLDSADKKVYKSIRGVDGFDNAVRNIKKLVLLKKEGRYKTTIGTQMVVCKQNIGTIAKLVILAKTLKVDYVQIRPLEILPSDKNPYQKKNIILY